MKKLLLILLFVTPCLGQVKYNYIKVDTIKKFNNNHIVVTDTMYGRVVYADTADTVLHLPAGFGGNVHNVRLSDGSVSINSSDTLNLNYQDFGLSATGTKSNISTTGYTGTVDIIDGNNTNLMHEMIFRRGLLTTYTQLLVNTGYGWDFGNNWGVGF